MRAYKVSIRMEQEGWRGTHDLWVMANDFIGASMRADELVNELRDKGGIKDDIPRLQSIHEDCEVIGDLGMDKMPERKNAWIDRAVDKIKSHRSEQ